MSYYNSYLLDELHRLFPAILYDQTQFQNNDLVQYIRRRMREVYNLYDAATTMYAATGATSAVPAATNSYARDTVNHQPTRESDGSSAGSSYQTTDTTADTNERYSANYYRRRGRRNAIYNRWRNESNQSLNRMNTPTSEPTVRIASPRATPHVSPQTSPTTPIQESHVPQFTVRSFLDTAAQDNTNDTLTAILGLLSLPPVGGNSSLYATPVLRYPSTYTNYYTSPHMTTVDYTPIARQRTPAAQEQSWAEILASFMNPIPIRPTQEQIDRATRLFMTDANSTRDSCVICFDAITDGQAQRQVRTCGHSFHRECIDRHFQTSPRCPLCRHDIREFSAHVQETNGSRDFVASATNASQTSSGDQT